MALEKLEAPQVLETVRRLEARVAARFPHRNLVKIVVELGSLIEDVASTGPRLRRRLTLARLLSRILMAVLIAVAIVLFAWALVDSLGNDTLEQPGTVLPLLDSTISDIVFAGLAVFFLYSLPDRLVRTETLRLLHRLRSMAHIVDMHQLAKDPERLRTGYQPTSASLPPLDLKPDELIHYLDYCSELLSLVGKAASLCAEESRDAVVLDTVSTVEDLTVNLSRKIWQKITLVNTLGDS
ncbi:MAG: hypothetical protein J2P23_11695 [Microlunatus sp.]|nr:hypothetical protein [Microlunatus sp.]